MRFVNNIQNVYILYLLHNILLLERGFCRKSYYTKVRDFKGTNSVTNYVKFHWIKIYERGHVFIYVVCVFFTFSKYAL